MIKNRPKVHKMKRVVAHDAARPFAHRESKFARSAKALLPLLRFLVFGTAVNAVVLSQSTLIK
jgi:hypothetical protein